MALHLQWWIGTFSSTIAKRNHDFQVVSLISNVLQRELFRTLSLIPRSLLLSSELSKKYIHVPERFFKRLPRWRNYVAEITGEEELSFDKIVWLFLRSLLVERTDRSSSCPTRTRQYWCATSSRGPEQAPWNNLFTADKTSVLSFFEWR